MFLGSSCMMLNIMQTSGFDLQVQADLDDTSTVAAAKANEVANLQFQIDVLKEAKERVQDELMAAAAASHSAAQVSCLRSALTVTDRSLLLMAVHLCGCQYTLSCHLRF